MLTTLAPCCAPPPLLGPALAFIHTRMRRRRRTRRRVTLVGEEEIVTWFGVEKGLGSSGHGQRG